MTSQVESYSGQNKQSFASLFSDYTLGRYCSDPSLDINSSRRLELDILFAYLIKNSSSSWLYKINDEVTGYLGMRKSDWDTNFWGFNFATIDHFYYHSHDPKEREKALNQLLEASNEWCASEQIAFASA